MSSNEVTPAAGARNHADMAKAVYILYAVGYVVGVTWVIGVIIAYVYRGDAPDWLKSHFTFQIWTFWLGLAASILGAITAAVIIGFLIWLALLVWSIVRLVKGWKWLADGQPVPKPTSLMLGE
jgi:uncharacterized membrane protein